MKNTKPKPLLSFNHYLVIMGKSPELGRVKTRLGRDIGAVEATRFYRHNLKALIRRCRDEKRWRTIVALAPDTSVEAFRNSYGGGAVQGQGRGSLGVRMQSVFKGLPPGPVIIIGSDIPQISTDMIAEAFHDLGDVDMVVGAGEDGGYWLIGMKRTPKILRDIFKGVAWSTDQTLVQTMQNLEGHSVKVLPVLNDIDEGGDYKKWQVGGAVY